MKAKKQQIKEISAMSAGSVAGHAGKKGSEEDMIKSSKRIRLFVREAIKIYSQKKKMLSAEQLSEQKLREFVRKTILSEKQSKEVAPGSTLEGIMRTLLNNIIPQLRIQYMQLQSNDEERQGFKDYFYNAVDQISDLTKDQRDAEEKGIEELEEEKITIKSDDPDFISGVEDGEEDTTSSSTKDDSAESRKDISSFFERGQNFAEKAFVSIKDRIQDVVASQIVPDEYPEFERVLNANLQAWFKIWDQNRTKESNSQLDVPQEPVEPLETGGTEQEAGSMELPPEESSEEPTEPLV